MIKAYVQYKIAPYPFSPKIIWLCQRTFKQCLLQGQEIILGNYPEDLILRELDRIHNQEPYTILTVRQIIMPYNKERWHKQYSWGKIVTRQAVRQY